MSPDASVEVVRLLEKSQALASAAYGLELPREELELEDFELQLSHLALCLDPAKIPANSPAGFYKMPSHDEVWAKLHRINEGLDKIAEKMAALPKKRALFLSRIGKTLLLLDACVMPCSQLIASCIAEGEPDEDMTYEEAVMMQEDDKWSRDSD